MIKRKLFIGAGAVVLAIGAFAAGKNSAKFTAVTTLFYTLGGAAPCKQITINGAIQNVTTNTLGVQLKSAGGKLATLYSATDGTASHNCTSAYASSKILVK